MDIKRVLIKLSGESLSDSGCAFNPAKIERICRDIKNVLDKQISVSIVIGGGNIIRGRNTHEFSRETADSMGMLATVINSLALRECFQKIKVDSVILSPFPLSFGIEPSHFNNIQQYINAQKLLIFAGGTGIPYFSTDTISVINAIMTKSDVILKATKPDGIYDKDPEKCSNAQHIQNISHKDVVNLDIGVMDKTAFSLAAEYKIPIMVFSINETNCFTKAIEGTIKHSLIS